MKTDQPPLRLHGVRVRNFRCLQDLTLDGLTRVNLIVGKNNTGKTALLEAVEWLESEASPEPLWQSLKRRGSRVVGAEGTRVLDLSELVFGQDFVDLGADGDPENFSVSGWGGESADTRVARFRWRQNGRAYIQTSYSSPKRDRKFHETVFLAGRTGLAAETRAAYRNSPAFERRSNVAFVPGGGLPERSLSRLWAAAIDAGNKSRLIAAVRLLEEGATDVNVSSDLENAGWGGIRITIEGKRRPVPASLFGDGSKRLFGLGLALASASGGTLLVDELDDGLHYGLLPRALEFVVSAARLLDVQVFATTHSHDLVASVAGLHESLPETAGDISIHRLEAGDTRARTIAPESVRRLIDANLDPRGVA